MSQLLVPEFLCTDLPTTKAFYVDLLGFRVVYERAEETFVYLARGEIELMFEQANGPGRRWITGKLEKPFGRGINFQIEIAGVAEFYAAVRKASPSSIYLQLEEKRYQAGDRTSTSRQFVVQDPDGYLLRFAEFFNP